MLKTVLIDDEPDAIFLLRKAIEKQYQNQLMIVGEADGVVSGKILLDSLAPDLVFLDIQMDDGTGFDLLQQVKLLAFEVVFVTAYDQFALKAFDFYAIGYLVKPFKKAKLYQIIDHLLAQKMNRPNPALKLMAQSYAQQEVSKMVIPNLDGFQVLDLKDVIYLKSDNNYTEFYLEEEEKIISSRTLKEYERLLHDKGFFRIHQQCLVNLTFVKSYDKSYGGHVLMKNGEQLPIGRRRIADFRRIFLE